MENIKKGKIDIDRYRVKVNEKVNLKKFPTKVVSHPWPGSGILSLEVHWARHLLEWGVHQYDRFFDWFGRQSTAIDPYSSTP